MTLSKGRPPPPALAAVELLILDCDGVLTDGQIHYDTRGDRSLAFYAHDGMGLALLCRAGIEVAIVSGRPADIAELRHKELGVKHFIGPCRDKVKAMLDLCAAQKITPEQCAFVGDDLADLAAMKRCGLAIAVPQAAAEIREIAAWITSAPGGRGAVREVCEGILMARGQWTDIVQRLGGT